MRNTLPSGEIVENKPILVQSPFTIDLKDAIRGEKDSLLVAIDAAAEDGLRTIMPQLFEYIGRLCTAAGTGVDAKGRPPSHELILEMLERIEIEFDDNGQPILPTLVMHPEMAKVLRAIPPRTPEQEARFQDLIRRKKQEHNDRRRHRKLP